MSNFRVLATRVIGSYAAVTAAEPLRHCYSLEVKELEYKGGSEKNIVPSDQWRDDCSGVVHFRLHNVVNNIKTGFGVAAKTCLTS